MEEIVRNLLSLTNEEKKKVLKNVRTFDNWINKQFNQLKMELTILRQGFGEFLIRKTDDGISILWKYHEENEADTLTPNTNIYFNSKTYDFNDLPSKGLFNKFSEAKSYIDKKFV